MKNIKILNTLAILMGLTIGLPLIGCVEEIDPQREQRAVGTFGEELYKIVYDNSVHSVDHSSAQFLGTFESHRDVFVDAVDTSLTRDDYDAANQMFIDVVPLYENMLYPGMLRKIGVVVDEVRNTPDAVEGIHYLTNAPNFELHMDQANPFGLVFGYDALPEITDEMLDLILKHTTDSRNATNQMLRELSIAAADLKPDNNPTRFIRRAFDMLFEPDDDYTPAGAYNPQIVAKLDDRGHAIIRPVSGSSVYAPFVDSDNDGRADLDANGWFILNDGSRVSPFETEAGAAPGFSLSSSGELLKNGEPVFETFDLQKTPLAYLLREGDTLLENETLDKALRATQTLLGKPTTYTDEHGEYTGFERTSGVAQLLAAVLTTLDHDSVGPNFEAAIWLLKHDQDVVARILRDVEIIFDIYDETPSNFSVDNNLIDRLLPEVLKLAQVPGMLDELLVALDDPMAANIAPILSELAAVKNSFISVDPNSIYEGCFQNCESQFEQGTFDRMNCIRACPRDEVLGTVKAEHDKPESFENRSLFQRITHLMWETSETPYEVHTTHVSYKGTDLTAIGTALGSLMSFDNLAEAYLLTYTRDLVLAEHINPSFINLASLIGADGDTVAGLLSMLVDNMFNLKLSTVPKTSEVTRLFNRPILKSETESFSLELNVATCRSGHRCLEVNADTLLAIEASGLADALYPIVKIFNKYGQTAVFVRIVAIIFEYYPTGVCTDCKYEYVEYDEEGNMNVLRPLEMEPMDFRSLEPVLIRALAETNVVADVGALCDALLNVELADGTRLTQRFEKFVEYLLTPDPELTNIMGNTFTYDPADNRIKPLSPAYLYIDGIRAISDLLDANPQTEDQLTEALDGIKEITIHTIERPDGSVAFEKPAGIHIVASVLELLLDIFNEHTASGDRKTWINETAIPEVIDLLSGRLLYAYFELFNELDSDPEGLAKFRRMVLHVMESGKEAPQKLVGAAYMLAGWILEQEHLYSLLRALASPIDPDRVWTTEGFSDLSFVTTILTTVNAFNQCDPTHVFNRVAYNLFESDTRERANLVRLMDIAYDLFRREPGSDEPRTVEDTKILLDFVYDLFTDDDRGVERIYKVIDYTIWGMKGRPDDWASHVKWARDPETGKVVPVENIGEATP